MNAMFKKEPAINVISKEEFEIRIKKVFDLLWETLSKSFGPYGAPTIIYNYPYSHITKDGYTIMKNTSMDSSEQLVDQAIAGMAADICGRLNYAVGDGTTTAVIATKSIYQKYLDYKKFLDTERILPRDILYLYSEIRDEIINILKERSTSVQSDNPDTLWKNIYNTVFISSNGDEKLSNIIADMYKELKCPSINCVLSTDGNTRSSIIQGYKFDLCFNDKTYINNDENTMQLDEADVIIFGVKITTDIYKKILKPLNEQCRMRKRHLVVCAPLYDETALGQVIRRELINEYNKMHDVNMVLCTYKAYNTNTRKRAEDFAMLCNTHIIDRELLSSIYSQLEKRVPIFSIFSMDQERKIPGTRCVAFTNDSAVTYIYETDNLSNVNSTITYPEALEDSINLGYFRDGAIGLETSVFHDFFYDENRYSVTCLDAKTEMEKIENKYKKLGTFNTEVGTARYRYFSLLLKMGLIEVGGDSELSQKMFKDTVDDAIQAASSAFNYGVVRGCNVTLLNTIMNECDRIRESIVCMDQNDENFMIKQKSLSHKSLLMGILFDGFVDVYRTLLTNAFTNVTLFEKTDNKYTGMKEILEEVENNLDSFFRCNYDEIFRDNSIFLEVLDMVYDKYGKITLHDMIIYYSILSDSVFDVTKNIFTRNVINSVQTDEEILIATIDLISLLMAGNQMVVTQRHNF